jgi:ELWxxDGT repeat protein
MDINPGASPNNSSPTDITAIGNGKALFAANDGTHGTELWVSDGTAGGTSLVYDINPGSTGSNPINITALGNGKANIVKVSVPVWIDVLDEGDVEDAIRHPQLSPMEAVIGKEQHVLCHRSFLLPNAMAYSASAWRRGDTR